VWIVIVVLLESCESTMGRRRCEIERHNA